MNTTFWGYLIAGIVAAIVSCIDLCTARDKGLYRSVALLCVLYASFDVATSIIVFTPFDFGADRLHSDPVAIAGASAGLIAALLMRTKVTVPFLKGRPSVNSVAMLRKLQLKVGTEIDDRCAASETDWILDKVVPDLKFVPVPDIGKWACQALRVKLNDPKMRTKLDECVARIEEAAADDVDPEDAKQLIVQILRDEGGRRLVIGLVAHATRSATTAEMTTQLRSSPPQLLLSNEPGLARGGEANVDDQEADEAGEDEDAGDNEDPGVDES